MSQLEFYKYIIQQGYDLNLNKISPQLKTINNNGYTQ